MLDPVLLREPSIKFYLNQALDMMNRAVAGNFQPGTRENMAYFVSTEKRSGTISSIRLRVCVCGCGVSVCPTTMSLYPTHTWLQQASFCGVV